LSLQVRSLEPPIGSSGCCRERRLLLPISLFKFAYFLLDTRKFVSPCLRKRLVFLLPRLKLVHQLEQFGPALQRVLLFQFSGVGKIDRTCEIICSQCAARDAQLVFYDFPAEHWKHLRDWCRSRECYRAAACGWK
jgi:hypothetical protein